jgi:gluconate 2-dehydrogenase alpha chain
MSTVITHPSVDVCVIGMGCMGGNVSQLVSLAAKGYKVVGLEKGPYWNYQTDWPITKYDEYGIQIMRKNDSPLQQTTVTIRNNVNQFALPIRRNTNGQATSSGYGVGGANQHYGAQFGRYAPWTYAINSNTISKYGQAYLTAANPNDDTLDFPVTYDDYLPYYQAFEAVWGVSGTNQEPNCPSSTFPMPAHPQTAVAAAFQSAAESLGINNWPAPSAIASEPYTNSLGLNINACVYDGWCSCTSYPCETGAKASSATRTVPAAIKGGNFDLRTNSYLFRIDTDSNTGLATQARYYDAMGNVHVQPATTFALATWGFYIHWALAVSGIGTQYNPTTVTGSLGRGIANPTGAPTRTATGTLPIGQNNYTAGNGQGGSYTTYDFADDNFDHSKVSAPYLGGTRIQYGAYPSSPGLIALGAAGSAANVGAAYKASVYHKTQATKQTISAASGGMDLPQTNKYIDLDPHYYDIYGDPLPLMTLDYTINSGNASNDSVRLWTPVVEKMGVTNLTPGPAVTPAGSHFTAWGIHIRGGIRIGASSSTSVMNMYNQVWGTPNVFATGEMTQPNGSSVQTGGTHPAACTSYAAADGILKYLTSPGPLVSE